MSEKKQEDINLSTVELGSSIDTIQPSPQERTINELNNSYEMITTEYMKHYIANECNSGSNEKKILSNQFSELQDLLERYKSTHLNTETTLPPPSHWRDIEKHKEYQKSYLRG